MNVTIQITFISKGQRVYQGGTFPLKGRTAEQVLNDWIAERKRNLGIDEILEIVIDGKKHEI